MYRNIGNGAVFDGEKNYIVVEEKINLEEDTILGLTKKEIKLLLNRIIQVSAK